MLQENRKVRCWDPTDSVDIALGETGNEGKQPITIPELYKKTFYNFSNERALCWKNNDGQWQNITYGDYQKLIYKVAKSFHKVTCLFKFQILFNLCVCFLVAWTGAIPCCWYSG